MKPFLILMMLVFFEFSASAQQGQTPPADEASTATPVPVDAARKTNPVKATGDSIARGKKLYGYDCAMCHGKDGDGKGDVAEDMKLKIASFSDPAAMKGKTDGELYYSIKSGKGQMPPEGDRGKPEGLWDLVNYVRSFGTKQTASDDKAAAPQTPN
jgi:mono/diheme cytochrome c family protein